MTRRHLNVAQPGDPALAIFGVKDSRSQHGAADELLKVGALAKSTGKTVRAIHLYEDLGLIESKRRSKGAYRLFNRDTEVRIHWISKMQSIGFSLSEIQGILKDRVVADSAHRTAEELQTFYEEQLIAVRAKLAELKSLEGELAASLNYLETCTTDCGDDHAVSECQECSTQTSNRVPDLVRGARLD